jgi:hypothetical protein
MYDVCIRGLLGVQRFFKTSRTGSLYSAFHEGSIEKMYCKSRRLERCLPGDESSTTGIPQTDVWRKLDFKNLFKL